MKKRIALLLLALLLAALLAGCSRQTQPSPVQPFDFYYRAQEPDYRSGYGVVGVETRDLGVSPLSDEELISLYLQGPVSESLVSPFPPGVQLLGVRMSATTLTVRLSSEYAALQGEYDAITLAADALRQADEELQSRFSPELGRLAAQYMSAMTGGRYEDLFLNRDFSARIRSRDEPWPTTASISARAPWT